MRILEAWQFCSRWGPIGAFLFARLIRIVSPYSASIFAKVENLESGRSIVSMRQRRRLGNPFKSIHAMALANLGELASGLAFLTTIPADRRGIVTAFRIDYSKKARGKIVAESTTSFPPANGPFEVVATLKDESGDPVAVTTATWIIGSREEKTRG